MAGSTGADAGGVTSSVSPLLWGVRDGLEQNLVAICGYSLHHGS